MEEYTKEQYEYETNQHIFHVRNLISYFKAHLEMAAANHDESKLKPDEAEGFMQVIPKLKGSTYGSDEYRANLSAIRPTIDLHQSRNRHHPEFHKNGVNDMTLVDVVEMFCDWVAATKRHDDGNIHESIPVSGKRFRLSPQIEAIFHNTAEQIFSIPKGE